MTSVRQEALPDKQQLITDLFEKITPYDIMVVSRPPKFAGVDPYNTPIDRNSEQNVTKVTGE